MNERSRKCLLGVHPDLVRVAERAFEIEPFIITCGLRSLEQQRALKAAGKSKTLNSRHLTGHAIDFAEPDGHYDLKDMQRIGAAFKAASAELGIPIEWGGDWTGAWDTPHVQLTWKAYPAGNGGLSLVQKTVEAVKTKPAIATAAVAATTASDPVSVASSVLPTPDLGTLSLWQAAGEQISALGSWAWQHPAAGALLALWMAVTYFWPSPAPQQGE